MIQKRLKSKQVWLVSDSRVSVRKERFKTDLRATQEVIESDSRASSRVNQEAFVRDSKAT